MIQGAVATRLRHLHVLGARPADALETYKSETEEVAVRAAAEDLARPRHGRCGRVLAHFPYELDVAAGTIASADLDDGAGREAGREGPEDGVHGLVQGGTRRLEVLVRVQIRDGTDVAAPEICLRVLQCPGYRTVHDAAAHVAIRQARSLSIFRAKCRTVQDGSSMRPLASRAATEFHDHAVAVYHDRDELGGILRGFIDEGVARGRLVVFVHAFRSDDDAWDFVEAARPGAREDPDVMIVSLYRQAFEADAGKIDFDHVLRVVDSLILRAKNADRSGVAIFVDASRVYLDGRREREWFDFETRLGRRLHHAVALVCAYTSAHAEDPQLLPDMLRTHAYRFDPVRS